MIVRIHKQRKLKESVAELFREHKDINTVKKGLKSLGFIERAEKPTLVVMENPDFELYVQVKLVSGGTIEKYEIVTFEEIEDALS